MNTKKFTTIALILILVFALAACGGDPEPPPEDTPVATETPAAPEAPEDPPSEAPEETPITPEETRWGPLAAEFMDQLAGRNYFLKYDMMDASMGPDGDVTITIDQMPITGTDLLIDIPVTGTVLFVLKNSQLNRTLHFSIKCYIA